MKEKRMLETKQTDGLLGLSGNPTHQGHIASVWKAKCELGLDRVWLLINPFNPHKDLSQYAPYEDRLQLARHEVAHNPYGQDWIIVSDFEQTLRARGVTNDSASMLPEFQKAFPDINPVWMMGADNLATMHTWGGEWKSIFTRYPMVVFARPGNDEKAKCSEAALLHQQRRVAPAEFTCTPGEWTFLETASHPASSTRIRDQIQAGEVPAHLCDESYQYIVEKGLYGSTQ